MLNNFKILILILCYHEKKQPQEVLVWYPMWDYNVELGTRFYEEKNPHQV